jgi:hypothetical protein
MLGCRTTANSTVKSDDSTAAADPAATALEVATTRATCPFIGSAVATQVLPIDQTPTWPLASIASVASVGDAGGGDLGSNVLVIFATGNHALMRATDDATTLSAPVPAGLFSLDFPGSQGSHPGHSGILEGDPTVIASGRFDPDAFARLMAFANNGVIKRSDVGKFIAGNLIRDPNSKVFGPRTALLLGEDITSFAGTAGLTFLSKISSAITGCGVAR